ncbi:MAG: S41 family peptidase [Lachnospiraceae bacterium]|nr:S41 family peptidase [Lachnospiraceae bacterium]
MAETEERQENNLQASEGKREEQRTGREFTKGMLFGILISAICVMMLFLVKHGTVGFYTAGQGEDSPGAAVLTSQETQNKLAQIQQKIESVYLYDIDSDLLSAYLFKGLAVGLNDPYANYYTAQELQDIQAANEGEYCGIGISVLRDKEKNELRIAGVYEGSPAEEAGLCVNDILAAVQDTDLTGMDLSSAVALIKNQKESVHLTILRDGQEMVFDIPITDIEIPTVSGEMLDDQTGYLKITEFDSITVSQFEETLSGLEEQGMEKLIVDVRDNPGGVLDAVCDILDDLLPEGMIVYTQDKNGEREEHTSDADRSFSGPLAVLVNGNSASAAEIFAGAIQDHETGTVIGTQTYGKGVVQRTYLLEDGSALKLTTEKYFTPKGRDINGEGITPDIIIEETDEEAAEDIQLQRAIETLQ